MDRCSRRRWRIRRLSHCQLTHEYLHETFYQTDRAVKTASKLQVRNPISNKSVGSWQNYAMHMTPFIEEYERLRPKQWGDWEVTA